MERGGEGSFCDSPFEFRSRLCSNAVPPFLKNDEKSFFPRGLANKGEDAEGIWGKTKQHRRRRT